MPSLHERCMDGVVEALEALDLPGDAQKRVLKRKRPDPAEGPFPCVFVTLEHCTERLEAFTTEHDEKVLPVAVHWMDRQDWRDREGLPAWLEAREAITSAFLMQLLSLATVPENWHNQVRTMPVLDAERSAGPGYQNAVGSFWVEAHCITTRVRN